MYAKVREGLLKQADAAERKAEACVRPADKHHYLLLAARLYKKCGFEAASRLAYRLADEALTGRASLPRK